MTDRTHPDSGTPFTYGNYANYAEHVQTLHTKIKELEAELAKARKPCLHQISEPEGEYPALPRRYTYSDEGVELFTADQMRAYVDAYRAMQALPAPADPLDTPLPCDLTAGGVTIGKGCPLRTVQMRLQVQADANALLLLRTKEALAAKVKLTDEDFGTTKVGDKLYRAQAADSVLEDAETALRKVLGVVQRYLPPDGPSIQDAMSEIIAIVDPWPLAPLEKP